MITARSPRQWILELNGVLMRFGQTSLGGTAMMFTDEKPQACEMYTVKAKGDLNAALTKAHDDLFYKATGLSDLIMS
jgi:hypothetical protein